MRNELVCAAFVAVGICTSRASADDTQTQRAPLVDFVSLRLMREKNLITQDEYDSARREIGSSVGDERAEEGLNLVVSKWSAQLYGFSRRRSSSATRRRASTTLPANALVARPIGSPQPKGGDVSQYGGSNPRMQFSVRNSRFGVRLRAPQIARVRASGVLEMDFLGFDQPSTEAAFFDNPTLRIRHARTSENRNADRRRARGSVLADVWLAAGVLSEQRADPGPAGPALRSRSAASLVAQVRARKHVARDRRCCAETANARWVLPGFAGGIRFAFEKIRGIQTTGATSTQSSPLSIAVTGDYRNFVLPLFEQLPTQNVSLSTGAVAVDAFVPIIPKKNANDKSNALSISGELAYGGGIADMYATGLTGGVTMPTIVN